jgi:hypothetical protein
VKRVEQPRHEVERVLLLRQLEATLAGIRNRLQELVRAHVALEVARVADLPHELAKCCDEGIRHTCVVGGRGECGWG